MTLICSIWGNLNAFGQRVRLFVRRVRENMLKMWEENIIKKAEELDSKVIQQHQQT